MSSVSALDIEVSRGPTPCVIGMRIRLLGLKGGLIDLKGDREGGAEGSH